MVVLHNEDARNASCPVIGSWVKYWSQCGHKRHWDVAYWRFVPPAQRTVVAAGVACEGATAAAAVVDDDAVSASCLLCCTLAVHTVAVAGVADVVASASTAVAQECTAGCKRALRNVAAFASDAANFEVCCCCCMGHKGSAQWREMGWIYWWACDQSMLHSLVAYPGLRLRADCPGNVEKNWEQENCAVEAQAS